MHVMSEDEWKAFLTAEPPRTGKLATVRKDGRPHVAPIWFDLDDDGSIVFTTGAETLKGKSIRPAPGSWARSGRMGGRTWRRSGSTSTTTGRSCSPPEPRR